MLPFPFCDLTPVVFLYFLFPVDTPCYVLTPEDLDQAIIIER